MSDWSELFAERFWDHQSQGRNRRSFQRQRHSDGGCCNDCCKPAVDCNLPSFVAVVVVVADVQHKPLFHCMHSGSFRFGDDYCLRHFRSWRFHWLLPVLGLAVHNSHTDRSTFVEAAVA